MTTLSKLVRSRAGRLPLSAQGEGRLAAAALCAAVLLVLSGLWILYLIANRGSPGAAASARDLTVLVYGLPAAAAGVLIQAHVPSRPAGWVLLAYAAAAILPSVASAPVWIAAPGQGVRTAVAVFAGLATFAKVVLFYSLPLWVPYGRLTSRWWWLYLAGVALWSVPMVFTYTVLATGFGGTAPLAHGWAADTAEALQSRLATAQESSHFVLMGVGIAAMLWQVRRASTRYRRPTLLLLATYAVWAGAQVVRYYHQADHFWGTFVLFLAASALWWVSVGYVLTYTGAWRVGRAARRILVGLVVTTVLTFVYVSCAAALAAGTAPGQAADALAALAFLLGAGLRRTTAWAVGLVDRLYYGDRAHPYRVLQTLAQRLSREVSPQDVPATLCRTVVEMLRLPGARLAVHTRAGARVLASAGSEGGPEQRFDLVHQGTVIGHLAVSPREGEEAFDTEDTGILTSLADQAAPALASLRLQEDLRSSREQIVTAREEERRSLRRDIHDGLGPALAGVRLRVENAVSRLPADEAVREDLAAVSADLGMAIKEVRRITDRLGPAPLGELGLTGALTQLAAAFDGSRLRVSAALVPHPLPPLPAAVEVAAYRIAAEALNNVQRHARAEHAEVRVRVYDHVLVLSVRDDGTGFPEGQHCQGVGMGSMADRAAEIGGRFTVCRLDRGTRVMAVLPRPDTAADPAAGAT
ncbi:histidine kinase [Streptomyces bambusae]|uniref:GAF domain-containing sensor histidine kinase n=1 Tax=Streptomyces bambusae TaxID=1550616 RepID=UPI001CFC9166|nr:ATP-binding protein [Streptomyces bambusae]MCB5165800.1 histidine kinase [Streptomyces bambusae]